MISFVVMAAMTIAPEADANIFKRRAHAAPAQCGGCAAPATCDPCSGAAPAPAAVVPAPADGGKAAPPAAMPKGDKTDVAPAPEKKPDVKVEEKKVEAPIEIPANLLEAINKSDQKAQIMEYLNNTSVPREKRIQYLESTVRPALLPDPKKDEKK